MKILNFAASARLLKKTGAEFNQEHEYRTPNGDPTDLPAFAWVAFPLSAEEWCSMLMRDAGHYLSGNDRAYSLWYSAFREGGGMSAQDLGDLAAVLKREGMKFFDKKLGASEIRNLVKRFAKLDPWEKVGVIWQLVRPHHTPRIPEAGAKWMKPVERSLRVLARSLEVLDSARLFASFDETVERNETKQNPEREKDADGSRFRRCKAIQSKAFELIVLAQIMPSLTHLYRHIEELAPPPIEGWAIWDVEAADIASNGLGLCIFDNRADVDYLFEQWRKNDAMYEKPRGGKVGIPIDQKLKIRPVRVTFEKGIEFLDEPSV